MFLPLIVGLFEPALRLLVPDSPTPVAFTPKLSRLASFGVFPNALVEFTLVFTFAFYMTSRSITKVRGSTISSFRYIIINIKVSNSLIVTEN